LVAIDVSLVGWLAQSYASAHALLVAGAIIATAVVTIGVVRINRNSYSRMKELENA
jgi:hypothetical protein